MAYRVFKRKLSALLELTSVQSYVYDVTKTIFPFGRNDPVVEKFEIRIQAQSRREATVRAANIGKQLGLMLISRS